MGKVFVYLRKVNSELFRDLAETGFKEDSKFYFSDFRGLGDFWAGNFLYNDKYDYFDEELESIIEDIVCRDRSLMAMNISRRNRLVRRYWNGIVTLFKNQKFDSVLCTCPDCYTLDIITRVAKKYNAKIFSFNGTFMKGYSRFTIRGESIDIDRNVEDLEVENVYKTLVDKFYLPPSETTNVKRGKLDIYKFYFQRRLIENFLKPLQRIFYHDKDNYHYNIKILFAPKFCNYYNPSFESYFTRVSEINFNEYSNAVYLPLHYIPEATTDYWCEDVPIIGYNNYIINLVNKSDKDITFFIKEHPAMMGKRELNFYKSLLKFENVKIIHPLDRSNELLEKIKYVVVNNGTVGVEALMRGKIVFALNNNYYSNYHPNAHLVSKITVDLLSIQPIDYDPKKFLKAILSTHFLSNYCNDKEQNECDRDSIVRGINLLKEKYAND